MLTLANPENDTKPKKGNPKWVKGGKSPNPGGRPAHSFDMQAAARAYAPDAIKALVIALHNPRERVAAATQLLDRGYGKPQINVHSQQEINVLHLIAAQALGAELQTDERPAIEAKAEDTTPKE